MSVTRAPEDVEVEQRQPPNLTHDYITSKATPTPEYCGVYFLVRDGRIVYIGRSVSVMVLIYAHKLDRGKAFDSYTFLPCKPHELLFFAAHYIKLFQPIYNQTRNKTARKTPKAKTPRNPRANEVAIVTPLGYFPSIAMAATFHGISRELATQRLRREAWGWSKFTTEQTPEREPRKRRETIKIHAKGTNRKGHRKVTYPNAKLNMQTISTL